MGVYYQYSKTIYFLHQNYRWRSVTSYQTGLMAMPNDKTRTRYRCAVVYDANATMTFTILIRLNILPIVKRYRIFQWKIG